MKRVYVLCVLLFATQRKFVRYRLHLMLSFTLPFIQSFNACDIVLTAISTIPLTVWFQFETHSVVDYSTRAHCINTLLARKNRWLHQLLQQINKTWYLGSWYFIFKFSQNRSRSSEWRTFFAWFNERIANLFHLNVCVCVCIRELKWFWAPLLIKSAFR